MPEPIVVTTETKSGTRTTEFWVTVITSIAGTIQLLVGPVDVNNKWVVLGIAIINGLYNISRGFAKSGVPVQEVVK